MNKIIAALLHSTDTSFDEYFRDHADEQEYEDIAFGLNSAGITSLAILGLCVFFAWI